MPSVIAQIISALLASLPTVALRLIMPIISEKMLEDVAKKIILRGLGKVVKLTNTKTDDEILQMVTDAWKKEGVTNGQL